jgi:hypothetical protein
VYRAFLRLGQILSLAALLATCGGHWFAVQSFAWARMLVTNAESDGLTVAVEKTFDGQHPCAICKSIASAKGKESKQQRMVLVSKVPLFCEEGQAEECTLRASKALVISEKRLADRTSDPAVPPPRSGIV